MDLVLDTRIKPNLYLQFTVGSKEMSLVFADVEENDKKKEQSATVSDGNGENASDESSVALMRPNDSEASEIPLIVMD